MQPRTLYSKVYKENYTAENAEAGLSELLANKGVSSLGELFKGATLPAGTEMNAESLKEQLGINSKQVIVLLTYLDCKTDSISVRVEADGDVFVTLLSEPTSGVKPALSGNKIKGSNPYSRLNNAMTDLKAFAGSGGVVEGSPEALEKLRGLIGVDKIVNKEVEKTTTKTTARKEKTTTKKKTTTRKRNTKK